MFTQLELISEKWGIIGSSLGFIKVIPHFGAAQHTEFLVLSNDSQLNVILVHLTLEPLPHGEERLFGNQ